MQSERERVAREARAEGAEVAQRVRASAERERTVLIAEAQAQADILRGQGEQEAIRIFAEAFKRDPAFFLVTHMPGRKPPVKGEVSTIIGYPFKEGEIVKLSIDEQDYEMFSKGDTAWVDTGSDKKVVAAMKAGKSLKIEGTSWRGTRTVDTYSLIGISAALDAIDKACN